LLLEKAVKRHSVPEQVLTDHGSQFKEQWKDWCREHGIEAQFAHPSYPQDKGKVERCIQNLNREFFQSTAEVSWVAQGSNMRVQRLV